MPVLIPRSLTTRRILERKSMLKSEAKCSMHKELRFHAYLQNFLQNVPSESN